MNLYNLKSVTSGHFAIAKFDSDFNVAAIYNLHAKGTDYTCDCPANNRSVVLKRCKHRKMLPLMMGAVNTPRFFDPEKGQWHEPMLGEAPASEASELPIPGVDDALEQPAAPTSPRAQPQAQAGEGTSALALPLPTSGPVVLRRR